MTFAPRVSHTVEVACACPNAEECRTERYVSDVRILMLELEQTQAILATLWRLPTAG